MTNELLERSPKCIARLAGVFFLLTMLLGITAQAFISESLIDWRDATATAANISMNESLFRLGFALYLLEMSCQIVMTVLFFDLFKPVSKRLSLLAAFFALTGISLKTMSRLFYLVPLLFQGENPDLSMFRPEQLQMLGLLLLKLNDQGPAIAMVFFGIGTLITGFLILRSTFLPRFIGVFGMVGGLGWLVFLYPPLGYQLFPLIALAALIGSVLQIVWFLAFGVNEVRWKERARVAAESIWR